MDWMSTPGPDKKATDLGIVKALEKEINSGNAPVAKAGEVAQRIEIGEQHCNDRLNELERDGLVASKKAGSAKVWWPELVKTNSHTVD